MRLRQILLLPLATAALLRAQGPLNRPVPLFAAAVAPSPGEDELSRVAARRAQELGFPNLAADLYRDLLQAEPAGAIPGDRMALTLAWVTALLDDNRPADAEAVLRGMAGSRGAAWHLREGLVAAQEGKFDAARVESLAIRPEELTADDHPWYFFLQGMLAGAAGDLRAAGNSYQQAERAPGVTALERARFFLAQEEARLRLGPVGEDIAEQVRRNAEQFQGTPAGYDFDRSYAVMLNALGRKGAAVEALQRDLLGLPSAERARGNDFRLLLGLIAGADDGAGRTALMQLLATGDDPPRQLVALELLRRASSRDPERSSFRSALGQLIAAPTPHPILEDLLFFRADLSLGDTPPDYAQAEADARELLNKFPGSPLRTHALGILTTSAWEQLRYRTAAAYADQARKEMPAGETRAEFGVLVAEAWFRAGDFPSAAGAYAAVLRERPTNVAPGDLMFQRVEAEIEANSLSAARAVLDQLASEPAFDASDRWRAEWNLARGLQLAGQTEAAYARINRVLASASASAPIGPGLRARMDWLQAQLAFAAHEYDRTLELTVALDAHPGDIPAKLQSDLQSTDALLKARVYFALHHEAEGLGTLENLRTAFPHTDAAVQSYLIAAEYYSQQDDAVRAQRLLTDLAEKFPQSPDAPFALYQAALQAEHRGQQRDNLEEATRLLENLATKYPGDDLVFYARLKEGDLLRTLNELPQAQLAYESLRNNPSYTHRPDMVYVLLALAECDNAQAASDAGHAESARALFEDLCDRVDAPPDVRVEAGYNLGHLLAGRDQADRALTIWWRDVVTPFLLDPGPAALLGAKGRYWMARTLVELGEADASQGRPEAAKKAWRLMLDAKLPCAELAEADLARLNAPAPKP